jgi:uncharacterized protein with PIN domain
MKFLLTRELGRLNRWLRILGYDSEYFTGDNLSSLLIQALRDSRVIITRNHRLPQSRGLKIVRLRSETLKDQLQEARKILDIRLDGRKMFTRCILCNQELISVDKEKIKGKVPGYVHKTQDLFFTCPKCKRVYWPGTHWGNAQQIMEEVR